MISSLDNTVADARNDYDMSDLRQRKESVRPAQAIARSHHLYTMEIENKRKGRRRGRTVSTRTQLQLIYHLCIMSGI